MFPKPRLMTVWHHRNHLSTSPKQKAYQKQEPAKSIKHKTPSIKSASKLKTCRLLSSSLIDVLRSAESKISIIILITIENNISEISYGNLVIFSLKNPKRTINKSSITTLGKKPSMVFRPPSVIFHLL